MQMQHTKLCVKKQIKDLFSSSQTQVLNLEKEDVHAVLIGILSDIHTILIHIHRNELCVYIKLRTYSFIVKD